MLGCALCHSIHLAATYSVMLLATLNISATNFGHTVLLVPPLSMPLPLLLPRCAPLAVSDSAVPEPATAP